MRSPSVCSAVWPCSWTWTLMPLLVEPVLEVGERRRWRRRPARARCCGTSATWSAIGLASRTRRSPTTTSSDDQPGDQHRRAARDARAAQDRHERVQQQRDQPGDREQQHDRAGRARAARPARRSPAAARPAGPSAGRPPARRPGAARCRAPAASSAARAAPRRRARRLLLALVLHASVCPLRRTAPTATVGAMTAILFVGDVVGGPGRRALRELLPGLRDEFGAGLRRRQRRERRRRDRHHAQAGRRAVRRRRRRRSRSATTPTATARSGRTSTSSAHHPRPANYLRSQPGRGTA